MPSTFLPASHWSEIDSPVPNGIAWRDTLGTEAAFVFTVASPETLRSPDGNDYATSRPDGPHTLYLRAVRQRRRRLARRVGELHRLHDPAAEFHLTERRVWRTWPRTTCRWSTSACAGKVSTWTATAPPREPVAYEWKLIRLGSVIEAVVPDALIHGADRRLFSVASGGWRRQLHGHATARGHRLSLRPARAGRGGWAGGHVRPGARCARAPGDRVAGRTTGVAGADDSRGRLRQLHLPGGRRLGPPGGVWWGAARASTSAATRAPTGAPWPATAGASIGRRVRRSAPGVATNRGGAVGGAPPSQGGEPFCVQAPGLHRLLLGARDDPGQHDDTRASRHEFPRVSPRPRGAVRR